MNLETFNNIKGVYICTKLNSNFDEKYLSLRKKEKRVLSDNEVKSLPKVLKNNSNTFEWTLREQSAKRFIQYLTVKDKRLKILEIGCGNGWFTNLISQIQDIEVVGLDINIVELQQASKVFNRKNVQFIYKDIFEFQEFFKHQFDVIVLNASVQYFENFEILLNCLRYYAKKQGEIHIIDSHFYKLEDINKARQNTKIYYDKMGFPEMSSYYFHHSIDLISDFEVLYKPKSTIFQKVFRKKTSPFLWIKKLL